MILLIAGLPATGKSTIAERVGEELGAVVLSTDLVRKRILPEPTYSKEEKALVYRVIFLMAEYLARAELNVILDGTFYRRELRREAYEASGRAGSKVIVVECWAPEKVVVERMRGREREKSLSDADLEVYRELSRRFEPIKRHRIKVDTSRAIEDNVEEIIGSLEKLGVLEG